MRQIWFIARAEIAQQMRERENLIWIFVMPIVFFYFIGTVTGGFGGGGGVGRADRLVLVAPADAGFLADELARRLEAQHFEVERVPPLADVRSADLHVRDAPPARRLVVPASIGGRSFTDAVLAGETQTLRVESGAEGNAASFDRIRIQRAVYGLLADIALTALDTGATPDAASIEATTSAPRLVTLEVTSAGRRRTIPSGFEQTIPGTMVMFTMLILLTGGAIHLVLERERGLLRRLASTPIPRAKLVAGKWLGKLLLGLVQLGFGVLAGTLLFRMSWGAALPMVIVILIAWAAFNASLALLLGNIARSAAQMAGMGVLATMTLASLGGCWWPIEVTPEWAQRVALVLPTGWTMDAMHRLISFGDPASAAAPHALALFASAAVLGAAGVRTFRYI
jgi:ABC-type multidrug transport system permease subunit